MSFMLLLLTHLTPYMEMMGLTKLPRHIHTLLVSACVWELLRVASSFSSPQLSASYKTFSKNKRFDWDVHVVSMVHSIVIFILAIPMFWDEALINDKIFGYSYYSGQVHAITTGYFLWDSIVCLQKVKSDGIGFVVHGVSCFFVFLFSFTPFLCYFGAFFLMYEMSTPFLNMVWFCDKTGLTGSRLQLVSGIMLALTFFVSRIVIGTCVSLFFYCRSLLLLQLTADISYQEWNRMPLVGFLFYGIANTTLQCLNFIWMGKIVRSIRNRFPSHGPPVVSPVADSPDAKKSN